MTSTRIKVYVQPRASRSEVVGMHGDAIRVRLAAPPVDNAANEALLALLAGRLGISRRCIRLVTGYASRRKVVEIDGVTPATARLTLLPPS